jgi:hypothetical protein
MKAKINRVMLDTTKKYIKVQRGSEAVYVGQFVRSYQMGSGDGTTYHLEFKIGDTVKAYSDEAYGSWSGEELVMFVPVPSRH